MSTETKQILEEARLRKLIRSGIGIVLDRRQKSKKEEWMQERRLRKVIRHLLRETAISDNDPTPHESTGINVLEDLLKKIIPIIEIDFKKLTTNPEQRTSFRAHIVQAVEDTIAPQKATASADGDDADKMISVKEQEAGIGIDVGQQDDLQQDKFMDIDDKPQKQAEPEDPRDNFGIEGQDTTGRNVAFESFKKVEDSIADAYDVLGSDEDREVFYDYLITNLKLYFDKFENDMGVSAEPTTDEYEAEKTKDLPPSDQDQQLSGL